MLTPIAAAFKMMNNQIPLFDYTSNVVYNKHTGSPAGIPFLGLPADSWKGQLNMKIIDSHTHIFHGNPAKLLGLADHFGYDRFNALSIPCYGFLLNNLECLLLKKLAPGRAYVYGGITYLPGREARPEESVRELELLMDAGCDGWKLLESKPSVYRRLRLPLDGSAFEQAFDFAEEAGIPLIWHCGDPSTFWDASHAPRFAVENGWLCIGEGYPGLEELDAQIENVLKRHPRLEATLAHLFFTSDRREYAEKMLDSYENLFFDLTPGSEMYWDFMEDAEYWRAFFERYQTRLVYGTDLVDDEGDVVFGSQDEIVRLVMNTLISREPFVINGRKWTGLALPGGVLEQILHGNFELRNGVPNSLNSAGLEAYASWLLNRLPGPERVRC